MKELRLNAYAKVNLALNILGKRDDGYHDIETVLHTVVLHDVITLRESGEGITVVADVDTVPADGTNLVHRAATLLREEYQVARPVEIEIRKTIPVASGLGGGSANAAVTLMGLCQMWKLRLDGRELSALAARLGSDVPFFLTGGAAVARGRGDRVQSLPALPPTWVVLACPHISVLTEWAYKHYHENGPTAHPQVASLVEAIRRRDVPGVGRLLGNVFEGMIVSRHPVVGEIKSRILRGEAYGAAMSGTGPSVFGLMANDAAAQRVAEDLRKLPDIDVFVTRTFAEER